jgi:hypothetical protein
MTWAEECGERLPLWCDEVLFEDGALVARHNRLADSNQAVAVSHGCWNVGNLIAARFALAGIAAKDFERFEKKRLDVVGLETACFGPLHFFANAVDARGVHGIVREGVLFNQILQL